MRMKTKSIFVTTIAAFFGLAFASKTTAQSTLNDGIPDAWRVQYFGADFATNAQALAVADADGDGASNFLEYQMGTDPTNTLSKPSVPVSVSTFAGTGGGGRPEWVSDECDVQQSGNAGAGTGRGVLPH